MRQALKNTAKILIVLFGFNNLSLKAQTNELQMLETEYNNSGQLFYILPHPSWNKTTLNELPKLLKQPFGVSSNFTFKVKSEEIEEKFIFTKADQMIGNYPVVGGDMIFKRDRSGSLIAIIGTLRNPESVSVPIKTQDEALSIAHTFLKITDKDYFSNGESLVQPKIELKYANKGGIITNKVVLCYEFLIMTEEPAEWYIYINATTGVIENSYNRLHLANGTGATLYSGNKSINTKYINSMRYKLIDTARNIETKNWRNSNLIANGNILYDTNNVFDSAQQKPGVDAHWGMGLVYDYFLNIHGRKSYDGSGGKITNNVRFKTNYNNAFFSSSTHEMYYGKGNGNRWADLVALDIVGHEFSHSLVNASANLVYQGESGALNESFADIFGHCIEMTGKGANWLMGEECFTPNAAGDALRDLKNPNNSGDGTAGGKCPDTYEGTHWRSTGAGDPDHGGVHYNSGVQNFWFYLLTEGGSGTNDAPLNHQYSVTAIGQDKSEKIAYRNLTRYLGSGSDYKAARKGALLAAEDIYGKNSNEYQQVCNAWYAVGVGEKCCTGNDSLLLTFKPKDPKCHDSDDGEIELTVKNKLGTTLVKCEYEWYKNDTNGVLLADTKDIDGLDSGRYVVIVRDTVNHCESTDKTTLKAPDRIKVTTSGDQKVEVPCKRSFTVVLTASATGGTGTLTHSWPDARKEVVCTGGSGFSNFYLDIVLDDNGCKGYGGAFVTYIPIVCSYDPNDIIGPPSYSDAKWVSVKATLPYKIRYENDPKFATGPAQKVTVSHKLDTNTNINSFRLGNFGFYKYDFTVPSNTSTYYKRLDIRDSFGIYLDVTAGVDVSNREAFWIFESIDPQTGLPPSSGTKGFLSINDSFHRGEGYVNYTIKPKSTSKTGDSIRAKAIIVFDDNPEVPTPRIHNLIDAVPPTSYIKSVPSVIDSAIIHFTLRGQDDNGGSGLANFDVYISENNGAYNLDTKGVTDTVITFKGTFGSSYRAYSIATDNTGNREATKTAPDVAFTVASKDFFKPFPANTSLCSGDTLNIRWFRSFFSAINLEYSADSGATYTTFATNLRGSDTLYRWGIPGSIVGKKNYFIRSKVAATANVIDSSEYFELKQGPVFNLGRDTAFCDMTSFSLSLDPGSGYSSYKWSDSSVNQTLTVTNYGTYWVRVTAVTGCKADDQIVVGQNLLPAVSTKTLVHPKCYGDTTGSIDLTVVSGNAPYNYNWNSTQTTQDLSNVAAGTYVVTISDTKACSINDTSILTQPSAPLTVSNSKVDVLCFGNSTGSIDLSVTGGTPSYTYSWTASAGGIIPSGQASGQDLTGLVAGTYNVTVTDANSCVAAGSITISQPSAALTSSKSQVNVLCFGNSTGSIDLTIAGGTTAYTYAWTASGGGTIPSGQSASQDLTGLTAGNYNVTITDANNCTTTNSATITQPSAVLSSSLTQVNVLCFGNSTGSIDLSVNGGTTTYTYAWTASGGGVVPSGQSTAQDLSGLVAGTYNVTVTDANNCTVTNSTAISQPTAALTSSKTQVNILCFGNSTGSIDLSVSGGTTGYSYAWTASGGGAVPSGQSTAQDLTGITAGIYNVTITDANGCTTNNSATISQPSAALSSSKTQVNVNCFGNANGSIDLSVTGGTTAYSYSWTASAGGTVPSGQSTSQDLTGLVPGTYSVTITDANGCTNSNSANITQPSAALTTTKNQVDVKCFGNATGSIDLSVNGGTTAYSYSWTASGGGSVPSGQSTSQDLTTLIAGTYNVTVTDANGCTATNSATISQPSAALTSSKSQVNVLCNGNSTGSIDLSVSGGTTAYTYAWTASGGGSVPTGQSTNQDLTNLIAGTYSVVVTDANGCTTNNSANITQPSALSSSKTQVNVLCFGNSTGSIDLSVSGGTAGYSYSWTASNGGAVPSGQSTSQDLSGLRAGTYSVTITDANGCTNNNSANITQPSAALSSSKSQVNVLCYGNSTGSIDLSVSGGTAGYSYSWTASGGGSVPSGQATNQDLTNLIAGTYNVTITDANGCSTTNSATITQPSAPLQSSKTQVNVLCNGNNTGSIDLTVSGGTTGYTYAWTASGGGSVPTGQSANQDLTSLVAGTYNVTVTDANGCTTTNSATITQPSAPLQTTKTQVDVLCFGNSTGSVDLTVTGGTTGYAYAWTASGGGSIPSGQSTNQDLTTLVAGTYNVTVTDANGCTATNSVNITQPSAALAATKTQVNVLCFGNATGAIDLSVTGGTTGYTYLWTASSGGVVPGGQSTGQDLTGLVAGNYSVTVTDANGCTTTNTTIITQPSAPLSSSKTQVNVLCFGNSTGAVNLTVNGGVLPYTFSWNSGDVTEDVAGKTTGMYRVTVTDKNNCILRDSAFISQPSAPLSSTLSMVPVNCFAGNDGSTNLSISGGTTPYIYLWSNGKNTEDLTGLTLGTYSVTVTDANNCTLNDAITVTQPAAPLATAITKQDVKCFAGNDGSADLTVTGGTTPYVFSWSNTSTTEDINTLTTGKYTILVTDKNLCTIKDSVNINQPAAPLSSVINAKDVNCFGGSDGNVTLTMAGGTAPYTYAWSNGAITKDLSNVTLGKYKVVVTDFNNCILRDSIVINQPAAPLAVIHVISNAKCNASSDGSINLTVTGGTVAYTYSWTASAGGVIPTGQAVNEDITGLKAGHYVVTITDKNLCTLKDSGDITEPTVLVITVDGTTATKDATNGKAWVNASGGTLPYSYVWSNSAPDNDTIFNIAIGTYIVVVKDANGCTQTDTIIVPEAPKTEAIKVFPIPSVGSLTVTGLESFGLDLPIHFELYDMVGKLQMSFEVKGKDEHTFELSDNLYNNSYILRMYNTRSDENRKVFLMR